MARPCLRVELESVRLPARPLSELQAQRLGQALEREARRQAGRKRAWAAKVIGRVAEAVRAGERLELALEDVGALLGALLAIEERLAGRQDSPSRTLRANAGRLRRDLVAASTRQALPRALPKGLGRLRQARLHPTRHELGAGVRVYRHQGQDVVVKGLDRHLDILTQFEHCPTSSFRAVLAAELVAQVLGGRVAAIVVPQTARRLGGEPRLLSPYVPGAKYFWRHFQDGDWRVLDRLVKEERVPLDRLDLEAAGFFDTVIAEMDRNSSNWWADPDDGRLSLIDHGFAFAVARVELRATTLADWRRRRRPALKSEEAKGLRRLLRPQTLAELERLIGPRRTHALERRCRQMLKSGRLVRPA